MRGKIWEGGFEGGLLRGGRRVGIRRRVFLWKSVAVCPINSVSTAIVAVPFVILGS